MILTQIILFLKFLIFGLIFGCFIGILKLFKILLNNKIINHLLDFIPCVIFICLYVLLISKLNFGVSRLYLLFSTILGIVVERISLGKLFAKLYLKLYNNMKLVKLKFTKTKLGKILFK